MIRKYIFEKVNNWTNNENIILNSAVNILPADGLTPSRSNKSACILMPKCGIRGKHLIPAANTVSALCYTDICELSKNTMLHICQNFFS